MPDSASLVPRGTWTADPAHSSAAFEVPHLGVSVFRAGFGDLEATLVAGEKAVGLEGAAVVESVSIREPELRGLLSPDLLEALPSREVA